MEKVNSVIDMIKEMDIKNKLRLGILISESNFTSLMYDKTKLYNYFDESLKANDEEYRTMIIDFSKYQVINFVMAKFIEMDSEEQNRVLLFLFNNLKRSMSKKYKNVY